MKQFLISLAALLLASCATRPLTDRATVDMLPKSIAKDIVVKHLGKEWANAPYVARSGCPGKDGDVPIAYSDIKGMTYNATLGRLFIMSDATIVKPGIPLINDVCSHRISFAVNAASVTEVSTALKALGACTSSQSFAC